MTVSNETELRPLVTITREILREYADASGDQNPIHQDDEVAKAMGLPGIIAHGMLVAGRLHQAALAAHAATPEGATRPIRTSKTRFRAMTLLGDELSFAAERRIDGEQIVYDLQALNQKRECVVSGSFRF